MQHAPFPWRLFSSQTVMDEGLVWPGRRGPGVGAMTVHRLPSLRQSRAVVFSSTGKLLHIFYQPGCVSNAGLQCSKAIPAGDSTAMRRASPHNIYSRILRTKCLIVNLISQHCNIAVILLFFYWPNRSKLVIMNSPHPVLEGCMYSMTLFWHCWRNCQF